MSEVDALVGSWRNADRETIGLRAVQVTPTATGLAALVEPARGTAQGEPCQVVPHFESGRLDVSTAFAGGGGLEAATVRLEANLNAGLLVLACYYTPGSAEQPACFSREYFSKTLPATTESSSLSNQGLFRGVAAPDRLDPKALLGTWRNAQSDTSGIRDIRIRAREAGLVVSASTTDGSTWEETPGTLYTNVAYGKVHGVAARVSFDHDQGQSALQVREVKGVLVVARFTSTPDQPPSFVREFFFRSAP